MASLFDRARSGIANVLETPTRITGGRNPFPDFGISELIRPVEASGLVQGQSTFNPVATTQYSTPAGPARSTGRAVSRPSGSQPVQQGPTAQQGPSQEEQLNAIYNPVNDFLNQLAGEYQAQLPEAESQIGTSFDRALTPIQEKEATEIGGLNKQEGVVNREEANALAQARQLFNELSQRNVALFGTGSSAGPAAQEILSRDTSRKFGSIGETATAGRTDIEGERTRVKTFTATKKAELEQQKQEAIRNLQSEFRQGLLRINQAKAQNESAKAQARMELLQQAQQQAFEIEQANQAYSRAIDMFEREKAANLAQVNAYQSQQGIDASTAAAINQILTGPGTATQKYVAVLQQTGDPKLAGTILGGLQKENEEDELGNPFVQ